MYWISMEYMNHKRETKNEQPIAEEAQLIDQIGCKLNNRTR